MRRAKFSSCILVGLLIGSSPVNAGGIDGPLRDVIHPPSPIAQPAFAANDIDKQAPTLRPPPVANPRDRLEKLLQAQTDAINQLAAELKEVEVRLAVVEQRQQPGAPSK